MKLVGFGEDQVGVLAGEQVVELTDLVDVPGGSWPPTAMLRLIRDYDRLAATIAARAAAGDGIPLTEVRLSAPVRWPSKLIAFPANYQRHIEEMRSVNRADHNGYFLKATSSIVGPNDAIVLPPIEGAEVHHECELGLVIGREGHDIPVEKALDYVFGFTCLIDVTVRGKQERVARKSFDTFTPTGPWLVTRDEIADCASLGLSLTVNGEPRQSANTRDLLLGIPEMVSMTSTISTVYPGDLIATGTPEGVGPIRAGDEVTITIESVGSMTIPVLAPPEPGGYDLRYWGRQREEQA
jgi:2-keto-4-pentenoate hydratase/2-oxohepta-3-ene-1,7-dioic acid hydratase in catechol pathway